MGVSDNNSERIKLVEHQLLELGWSWDDLEARFDVHRNTKTNWRNGKTALPEYVTEYLRVMLHAKAILHG